MQEQCSSEAALKVTLAHAQMGPALVAVRQLATNASNTPWGERRPECPCSSTPSCSDGLERKALNLETRLSTQSPPFADNRASRQVKDDF